jgi:alpha-ketoglutarate-dependent taurine dioxygenase
VHLDMQLSPGDVQLVSNHTVVHARTSYVDDPSSPRHLLRLWLSLA